MDKGQSMSFFVVVVFETGCCYGVQFGLEFEVLFPQLSKCYKI